MTQSLDRPMRPLIPGLGIWQRAANASKASHASASQTQQGSANVLATQQSAVSQNPASQNPASQSPASQSPASQSPASQNPASGRSALLPCQDPTQCQESSHQPAAIAGLPAPTDARTSQPTFSLVELTSEIRACTAVSPLNHSALRSGFAGYPSNPRWSGAKVMAWRLGKQWREALQNGEIAVREQDGLLVQTCDLAPAPTPASVALSQPASPSVSVQPATAAQLHFSFG